MTNEPKAGKGLDPDMLAAYIDNRLPPEQRASVEAELAHDPDSYAVLVETIKALDEGNVPEVRTVPGVPGSHAAILPMPTRAPKTRWVVAGGVLAVAAALAMVVWLQPEVWQRIRGGEPVDPLMAKLVEAVGEERYIEARLTGGFKYGPLRSVTRGPGAPSQQNLALLAAAGELQKRVKEDPSGINLHGLGLAQMQLLDPAAAVVSLSAAAASSPSANTYSDLSAAYLDGAVRLERSVWLPEAMEAALKALELEPAHLEASHNRALAAELLGAASAAIDAWQRVLEIEVDASWRQEILRRVGLLQHPTRSERWRTLREQLLSGTIPGTLDGDSIDLVPELRTFLLQESLPDWIERLPANHVRGPSVDPRDLAQLLGGNGDRFYVSLVDGFSDDQVADARSIVDLKSAYTTFASGLKAMDRAAFSEALPLMRASIGDFAARNRELSLISSLNAGACEYYTGEAVAGRERLLQVRTQAAEANYIEIATRAEWLLGLIAFSRGELQAAEEHYEATVRGFQRSNDRTLESRGHGLLASLLAYVGEGERGWFHRVRALGLADGDSRNTYTHLATMADQAMQMGLLRTAIDIQSAAISAAEATGIAGNVVEALALRATLQARLGYRPEPDLERAEARLKEVSEPALVVRFRGQLDIATAEIYAGADPPLSIMTATRAIAAVRSRSESLRLARLYRWLSEARTNAGDVAGGLAAAEAGTRALEEELAKTDQPRSVSRVDTAFEVIDAGILAAVRSRSDEQVFGWTQRGRQLVRLGTHDEAPRTLTDVQARMKDGEALLVLSQVGDRVLSQFVDRGRVHTAFLSIAAADVARLVDSLRRRAAVASVPPPEAAELFSALIQPSLASVPVLKLLRIVPSGVLAGVPYAALRMPDGRFLIEQVSVVTGRRALLSSARPMITTRKIPSVLVAVHGDRRPDAPPLPMARAEAKSVAAIYARTAQESASGLEFLRRSSSVDVVHVASHAVVNEAHPGLSRIFLGPGPESDLRAFQVRDFDLRNLRTVFLSACSTGLGRLRRGEGALSLADAFLQAGAYSVVGTLWDVGDDSIGELANGFHRRIAAGRDPISAIRDAQVELIGSRRPFAVWAAAAIFVN